MVRHFVRQPLSSTSMLVSGGLLLIGLFSIWPNSESFGFTITLTATVWFAASIFSFIHAE